MSVGFIQIGQCGNQLGQSFYEFLITEALNSSPASQALVKDIFFFLQYQKKENDLPTAKALLIDMEPKVVNKCLQRNTFFNYSNNLSFTKQEGSGNNWAYGYNVHGPKTEEQILQRVNKLLEETDYMEGFYLISSLAGGTGSGVGSFLQQTLSDNFDKLNLMNICVLPHLTGEVIIQSLNATLTISSLYQHSQGIILLSNDSAAKSCNQLLEIKSPSLQQINSVMSTGLASFFWPAIGYKGVYSSLQNNIDYLDDTIMTMLTDPRYKLLQLQHIPQMPPSSKVFSNDTWVSLEKRIVQMTLTGTMEFNIDWNSKNICRHQGCLMIARGHEVGKHEFDLCSQQDFQVIKDTHQFNGNEKSISSLHNTQTSINNIDQLVERASQMLQENAYIYQYEKFGIEKQHFIESLGIAEQIIQDYKIMK